MTWVAGYVMRQFTCPKAVTHPSTNRARCRATALIETNALPLHQTANRSSHLISYFTLDFSPARDKHVRQSNCFICFCLLSLTLLPPRLVFLFQRESENRLLECGSPRAGLKHFDVIVDHVMPGDVRLGSSIKDLRKNTVKINPSLPHVHFCLHWAIPHLPPPADVRKRDKIHSEQ